MRCTSAGDCRNQRLEGDCKFSCRPILAGDSRSGLICPISLDEKLDQLLAPGSCDRIEIRLGRDVPRSTTRRSRVAGWPPCRDTCTPAGACWWRRRCWCSWGSGWHAGTAVGRWSCLGRTRASPIRSPTSASAAHEPDHVSLHHPQPHDLRRQRLGAVGVGVAHHRGAPADAAAFQPGSSDDPAGRSGQQGVSRVGAHRGGGGHPTVASHQAKRGAQLHLVERALEAADVSIHDRADVRGDGGGVGSRVPTSADRKRMS